MIRETLMRDAPDVLELYRRAARRSDGLARTEDEYTLEVVLHLLHRARDDGLSLVAEEDGIVVAEIHALRPAPRCFGHVLNDLTMAVAPDHQGQGLGRRLFSTFLEVARLRWPEVLRVELFARESNKRAIRLYDRLGFRVEGILPRRIRRRDGSLESDVMMAYLYTDDSGEAGVCAS